MRNLLKFAICASSPLWLASIALGQDYIGRYDIYTGYMYLSSPLLNLGESGFNTQIGMQPAKWYSLGFDFSAGTGDTALIPSMLKSSLRQQIAAQLAPLKTAGLLPANYEPSVPMQSRSQTYATGPKINFRHFRAVTVFFNPDLGAIHETAVPHATDPIGRVLVENLAPSGIETDWTYFYGIGAGVNINATRHVLLKVHVDFVRDHLFSGFLNWQSTLRFSLGPVFQFGRNIAARE
jgi:hypothetical protein